MNTRDLIVGHFEGTLTQTDQGRLDQLLDSSPEARADFERHQMIEDGLAEDSRSLIPPIGLREATLAAAFGGAVSTIGGGLAAWFTAKVAVVVGAVAVGGLVVGGVLMSEGEDPKGASDNQTPVVQVEEDDQSTTPGLEVEGLQTSTDANEMGSDPGPDPVVRSTTTKPTNASNSTRSGATVLRKEEAVEPADKDDSYEKYDLNADQDPATIPSEKVKIDSNK